MEENVDVTDYLKKLREVRTSPLMPICTICKDNIDPKKNAIQNAKLYKKIQGCKRYAPR